MTSTSLADAVQAAFAGGVLGVIAGWVGRFALVARNLRWTWALIPLAAGAALIWGAGIVETWSVGLVVGGFFTARWTARAERLDREAGGDTRRRVRAARGIRDAIAARLSRHAPLINADGYLVGFDGKERPVRVRYGGESGRHGLLVGASGSGKSNALMWAVARHIQAGFGVVVIDMKGDDALGRWLDLESWGWRVPFYCWTLDGGDRWNPLARGNSSELKDKLIGSEDFSERHYQAMYERYLVNVFRALEDRPDPPHLREVIRLLDPAELAMQLREVADERLAEEIGGYVARLTPDQARDLRGLADRLALLVEGAHGVQLLPSEEPDGEIDLLDIVRRGAVVLFSLNSSCYGATARLVGNMVVQDLKTVCGAIEEEGGRRPALVAVDEFSSLDSDHIGGLFQRARSAGISLVLATQELADLRRVDDGFDEQIIGNIEWLLAGRQNNPNSAELIAGIAGTEEVWVHTFQTDEVSPRQNSRGARESGIGTRHRGREYHVPPDDIKRLPVGRMVLVEKNPHRVRTVDVIRVRTPASADQVSA
jgi:hypothetical protein